jgi:hypothetical protein
MACYVSKAGRPRQPSVGRTLRRLQQFEADQSIKALARGARIRNRSPAVIQIGSYMAIVWAMAGEAGPPPAFALEYDVQLQDVRELVVATPRARNKLTLALVVAMLSGLVAVGFTAITIALN